MGEKIPAMQRPVPPPKSKEIVAMLQHSLGLAPDLAHRRNACSSSIIILFYQFQNHSKLPHCVHFGKVYLVQIIKYLSCCSETIAATFLRASTKAVAVCGEAARGAATIFYKIILQGSLGEGEKKKSQEWLQCLVS